MTETVQAGASHETLDFFWSCRSHYCYLAAAAVLELRREFAIGVLGRLEKAGIAYR